MNENEYAMRIMNALPPVDGVEPAGRSARGLAQILSSNGLKEREALEIVETVEAVKKASASVGLKITVNDLKRLVGIMKDRCIAGREEKIPLLPPLYKGVSFNPSTFNSAEGRKEWIMLLDFFSFMRSLSKELDSLPFQTPPLRYAVFDASFYWIVNLLGEKAIRLDADSPEDAAGQLIGFLKQCTADQRFSDVYEVAKVRNAYMRAVANQFPANIAPPVFGLMDVWEAEGFREILGKTMSLFCKKENGFWKVADAVKYERYMPYSPWVTPLVSAEQAFMGKYYGFESFLAPTAEAAWNRVVDQACRSVGAKSYVTFMYSRGVASALPYDSIPFFSDGKDEILKKISSQQALESGFPELAVRMISQFNGYDSKALLSNVGSRNLEPVAADISDFCSKVDAKSAEFLAREAEIPKLSLQNMGWLMSFPPGIC
ncbi:MAG: hypothetical protein V1811_03175 [Candidatus Micrarchaeota archaeon]